MKKSIALIGFLMALSSSAFAYNMTSQDNPGVKIVEWSPQSLLES